MSFLSRASTALAAPADIEAPPIELPVIVPAAPKALEQRNAAQAVVDALEASTGRMSLNRSQGKPGAGDALRTHLAAVAAAKAEFDLADRSYDAALVEDAAARQRLRDAIRNLDPDQAVEGITSQKCCDLCGGDNGCILMTGRDLCGHPFKGSAPELLYGSDAAFRTLREAALAEIRYHASPDQDDDDEEGDED